MADFPEHAINALLTGDANVAAKVGNRIYPGVIPEQATMPLVAYFKISGPRDHSFAGPSGFVVSRFQIDSYGDQYSEAKELSNDVRKALDGFDGTSASVAIGNIRLIGDQDLYDEIGEQHRVSHDYEILYQESV